MALTRRGFLTGCGCMAGSPFIGPSYAQGSKAAKFHGKICSFGPSPVMGTVTNIGPASKDVRKIIGWITDSVGIRQNFKILAADIERYAIAFATIRDGRRHIVYDRRKFSASDGRASWSDVATLGHEVGHHLAAHVYVDEYSGHEQELEADRFSGFALSKLGATLDQATSRYWDWPETKWHPAGALRKKAVEAGWRHGEKIKARESGACTEGWASAEQDVDGATCRIVRSCQGRSQTIRLACKDYDDRWRWVR